MSGAPCCNWRRCGLCWLARSLREVIFIGVDTKADLWDSEGGDGSGVDGDRRSGGHALWRRDGWLAGSGLTMTALCTQQLIRSTSAGLPQRRLFAKITPSKTKTMSETLNPPFPSSVSPPSPSHTASSQAPISPPIPPPSSPSPPRNISHPSRHRTYSPTP